MPKRTAHIFEDKWRSSDVKQNDAADFSSLLLSEKVLLGLAKAGFKTPSPIQLQAIPVGRIGSDLIVQAKSGTGKTLVFTIIALELLLEHQNPQVLILAPTREIAYQICDVIKSVSSTFKSVKCRAFIGGIAIEEDRENLVGCQIVVGTPGRIKQLIQLGALPTRLIRIFVLDEADQLLEQSFSKDMDAIFVSLPKEKQIIATSATYPKSLKKMVDRYFQQDPYVARLNINDRALLGTLHYIYVVKSHSMPVLARRAKAIALENVLTSIKFLQCLVFCNSITRVENIFADIEKMGFSATYITSRKDQAARLKAIDCLKRFKCKVLVTSDLTSRGIDAESVDLIINVDAAYTAEIYLHRVGRAGRFGAKGLAISFIAPEEMSSFKDIQKEGNFNAFFLPDPIPSNLISRKPDRKDLIPLKRYLPEINDGLSDTDESASDSEVIIPEVATNGTKKASNGCVPQNMNGQDSASNIHEVDTVHSNGNPTYFTKESTEIKLLDLQANTATHDLNSSSSISQVFSPVSTPLGDTIYLASSEESSIAWNCIKSPFEEPLNFVSSEESSITLGDNKSKVEESITLVSSDESVNLVSSEESVILLGDNSQFEKSVNLVSSEESAIAATDDKPYFREPVNSVSSEKSVNLVSFKKSVIASKDNKPQVVESVNLVPFEELPISSKEEVSPSVDGSEPEASSSKLGIKSITENVSEIFLIRNYSDEKRRISEVLSEEQICEVDTTTSITENSSELIEIDGINSYENTSDVVFKEQVSRIDDTTSITENSNEPNVIDNANTHEKTSKVVSEEQVSVVDTTTSITEDSKEPIEIDGISSHKKTSESPSDKGIKGTRSKRRRKGRASAKPLKMPTAIETSSPQVNDLNKHIAQFIQDFEEKEDSVLSDDSDPQISSDARLITSDELSLEKKGLNDYLYKVCKAFVPCNTAKALVLTENTTDPSSVKEATDNKDDISVAQTETSLDVPPLKVEGEKPNKGTSCSEDMVDSWFEYTHESTPIIAPGTNNKHLDVLTVAPTLPNYEETGAQADEETTSVCSTEFLEQATQTKSNINSDDQDEESFDTSSSSGSDTSSTSETATKMCALEKAYKKFLPEIEKGKFEKNKNTFKLMLRSLKENGEFGSDESLADVTISPPATSPNTSENDVNTKSQHQCGCLSSFCSKTNNGKKSTEAPLLDSSSIQSQESRFTSSSVTSDDSLDRSDRSVKLRKSCGKEHRAYDNLRTYTSPSSDSCSHSIKQRKSRRPHGKAYHRPSSASHCCHNESNCSTYRHGFQQHSSHSNNYHSGYAAADYSNYHYGSQQQSGHNNYGSSAADYSNYHYGYQQHSGHTDSHGRSAATDYSYYHYGFQQYSGHTNNGSAAADCGSCHYGSQQNPSHMNDSQFAPAPSSHQNAFHFSSAHPTDEHTTACFMPSQNRCPNPSECQSQACAMWYDLFYRQWNHIQQLSSYYQ